MSAFLAFAGQMTAQAQSLMNKEQTMEPTLSLLVIDLGDSCVVKVEKGELDLPIFHTYNVDKTLMLAGHTFEDVRSFLAGDKPAIRLEDGHDEVGNFMLFADKAWSVISPQQYNALSQLAGKPLPIYEGGKWEWLNETDFLTNRLVQIYRYTR